ncbi:hypothetical protein [Actinocrispum wychmicini]|uniref:Uncharacterized protein n=1 Tax=Actinocrispum wychmicini TaxID=1213861 RepID=A0A4R2J9M6_9PSEU|nr:hypothetical protein [Actinocrispum wychmicini]TCO56043.1 hypothetical protein EV192_107468 [Actinocrispum wychmicini]
MSVQEASSLQLWGAGGFGSLVGWYLYHVNRHRVSSVRIADLVSVVGAIGGGAVLAIFPSGSDLFGAYGIGLFAGFFGYFLVLIVLVTLSRNFGIDYFIDGRRRPPAPGEQIPSGPDPGAMGDNGEGQVRG